MGLWRCCLCQYTTLRVEDSPSDYISSHAVFSRSAVGHQPQVYDNSNSIKKVDFHEVAFHACPLYP